MSTRGPFGSGRLNKYLLDFKYIETDKIQKIIK
jgi:hypothetical protein